MLPRLSKRTLKVPLAFTRYFVYTTSLAVTLLCVLLPLSVLTYSQFYKALVPQATQLILLTAHTQDIDLVSSTLKLDPSSDYRVSVKLKAVCSIRSKGRILQFPYTFSAQGSAQPLYSDSFFIDCDSRYIHNAHNRLVPYNLRYWLSPWLVNLDKTSEIELHGFLISGRQAASTIKHMTLQIACGGDQYFMIDAHASLVAFSVVYSGFRYYLAKYFYLCVLLGLLVFWCISSTFCLATVSFIMLRNPQQPLKGDKQKHALIGPTQEPVDPEDHGTESDIAEDTTTQIKREEDDDGWEDELTTKVED